MSQKAFSKPRTRNFVFGRGKIWILIVILVIVVGGVLAYKYLLAPEEEKPLEKEEVSLPIPTAPALTFYSGTRDTKPFIQINWDWSVADYFNVYRATVPEGPWEKIIENFPQSAHTAVDYDYPKDAKVLYYRITSVDEVGNESKPSEVSSVNIEEDETANWKTYRNEKYGYEVKYPEEWKVNEFEDSVSFWAPTATEYADIVITIEQNPSQDSLQEWLDITKKDLIETYLGEVVVGDIKGQELLQSGLMGSYRMVYFTKRDKVWQISTPESFGHQNIFDQMLSTFRFLE